MAYNVLADVLRGIRIDGTFVSSDAQELLENLREWLYFSWMTERQQRKDSRRKGICCSRATFCWQKYDKVRKRIHFNDYVRRSIWHDTTTNTISVVSAHSVQ